MMSSKFYAAAVLISVSVFASGCASRESLLMRENARAAGLRLRQKPVEWEKAIELDFESPEMMKDFKVVDGKWEIKNGKLCAVEGKRNRAVLLVKGFEGPVRLEIEAVSFSSDGLVGDITVLLNASADDDYFRAGYALTTGSYWNTLTTFYKKGAAIAGTSWSPVVPGKKNFVVVEFNDGHIRYELNGERLLELWDENPLVLSEEGWIGIRTWSTLMRVDRVVVYRRRLN